MTARLEGHHQGGAVERHTPRARICQRDDLGVGLPRRLGEPPPDDHAVDDHHRPDGRVRRRPPERAFGQGQGLGHPDVRAHSGSGGDSRSRTIRSTNCSTLSNDW